VLWRDEPVRGLPVADPSRPITGQRSHIAAFLNHITILSSSRSPMTLTHLYPEVYSVRAGQPKGQSPTVPPRPGGEGRVRGLGHTVQLHPKLCALGGRRASIPHKRMGVSVSCSRLNFRQLWWPPFGRMHRLSSSSVMRAWRGRCWPATRSAHSAKAIFMPLPRLSPHMVSGL
jgi:hypothetical protein